MYNISFLIQLTISESWDTFEESEIFFIYIMIFKVIKPILGNNLGYK